MIKIRGSEVGEKRAYGNWKYFSFIFFCKPRNCSSKK
jgi:hypothetical protein